jgi:PBP4 family serine-type D-alanyl-D-alanine carboxypeptidase
MRKIAFLASLQLLVVLLSSAIAGQVETRLQQIMNRPDFRHAFFGIDFYSLDKNKPLYTLNPDKLFVPGSTTKLITAGSALALFGPDYRFHTYVYRTGEITNDGILNGDLVLLASGDPNLSGRIGPNDTLLFENEDHSYGGDDSRGVSADPILVIHEIAKQVANGKVKQITGRVIVDANLFAQGDRELGTGVVISPIVVNDNLVDVLVSPGTAENSPALVKIAPVTSYFTLINQAITGKAGTEADLHFSTDIENSDGTRTVTLTGTVPLQGKAEMDSYAVPDPARFAEIVLTESLREVGITANPRLKEDKPDYKALAAFYKPDYQVAEHVSPVLSEEIKVMLKVSQNLHASMMPFLLSALIAKKEAPQGGFDLIQEFLKKAGLDVSGASQSDGAGGSAHFTPDFMVHYLSYLSQQKTYPSFHDSLPILGRDGTLFNIQVDSPAAGHVFAKTGTYYESDMLNHGNMVTGKGLAGYMTTKSGKHVAFAIYVNNVFVKDEPNAVRNIVGQALGEIAAAAWETL